MERFQRFEVCRLKGIDPPADALTFSTAERTSALPKTPLNQSLEPLDVLTSNATDCQFG